LSSVPPYEIVSKEYQKRLIALHSIYLEFDNFTSSGTTPVKRGVDKKLVKNGVHWQTLRTSKSERAANEPTGYILPEYGLSRKGAKREGSCSGQVIG
jgi:hypothetical protein